jgi:hypothetical protein
MLTGIVNAVTIDGVPQAEKPVQAIVPAKAVSTTLGIRYTEQQVAELVKVYATKYGVSQDRMINTIKCESQYRNVQSGLYNSLGEREDSWGIVQIHLPSNTGITKAQALDPSFAVEFMAKRFSQGYANRWTCYRTLYQ